MKSKRNSTRILGIVLVLAMMLTSIPFFTASAVKENFTTISSVSVSCIAPVSGNTNSQTATSGDSSKYIVKSVSWTQS
ncbi:MAG: hypothetical protein IKY44_05520, partial [Clostridia bacterium]|nr:hypothetical protein [Clostridia bacterium]